MAKHHHTWNQGTYEKYIREGRGCGSGADYLPWIRVQDFASRGMASRVKGRTTGRVHHLMSNNELAYFYILDWSDSVIDIREQYPLSDLSGAVRIAAQAGIKYPADKVSGYPYVLTCDFMVTTITGVKARTIKMTDELESDRVLEKLEIERRYWLAQGIEWKIITEREILFQKAKNIEWLCTEHNFSISSPSPTGAKDRMMQLLINGKYSIIESAYAIENEYSLPVGTGIQLFKQLVLAREFTIDLDKPINLYSKEATA